MSNGSRKPRKRKHAEAPSCLMAKMTRTLRIPLSDLPSDLFSIKAHVNAYRILLEEECTRRHGVVTATRAGLIQTAMRYEQNIRQVERMLKENWETFDAFQRAEMFDRIGKFSDRRDAAITKLDLDSSPMTGKSLFGALDVPALPVKTPATPMAQNVTEEESDVQDHG